MANKDSKKSVETLTHDEARRKDIPTAEYQSVMWKCEGKPFHIQPVTDAYIRLH